MKKKLIVALILVLALVLTSVSSVAAKKPVTDPIWDEIPIYEVYPYPLPIVRSWRPGHNK